MTSTKGTPQLDLKAVRNYCTESQSITLSEMWVAGTGWTPSPYDTSLTIEEQTRLAIEAGATHFNFAITDKTGTLRYPDFGIREITDQNYGLDGMTPIQL